MVKDNNSKEELASMSLGDHLEELRARLIMIILGVIVGLIFGLLIGKQLIHILEAPYYRAVRELAEKQQKKADEKDSSESETGVLVKITISEDNIEHIKSLRPGDSFYANMEFYQSDPNRPVSPFPGYNPVTGSYEAGRAKGLQAITPAEGFIMFLKVSLVFGIILTSPWLFWQIWAFVSAGLYKHERKFVHVVSPISGGLFVVGSVFFLLVVAPFVMSFFIRFNTALSVESNWTLQSYMNMILMLTLVFGAAFQSPIAIVFAERMGLVSIKSLTSARKYVFLGCFVVSAMITPPDPVSQVSLAIPLYILYEAGIVVSRIWKRKREKDA
jgi:sec-independent protein translocase protein TatC